MGNNIKIAHFADNEGRQREEMWFNGHFIMEVCDIEEISDASLSRELKSCFDIAKAILEMQNVGTLDNGTMIEIEVFRGGLEPGMCDPADENRYQKFIGKVE